MNHQHQIADIISTETTMYNTTTVQQVKRFGYTQHKKVFYREIYHISLGHFMLVRFVPLYVRLLHRNHSGVNQISTSIGHKS